jgi:hypothetical protein
VAVDGIKVKDEKSQEVLKTFQIQRISFISHDPGDSKVFALIDGVQEEQGCTLHAFKTERGASVVTSAIKQLFQLVYKYRRELQRKESGSSLKQMEGNGTSPTSSSPDPKHVDTITGEDLFSDLTTVKSQMKANSPAEEWYQVPKQITSETPKEDFYQVPKQITSKTSKEDLYQVPSNLPIAQADKTDGASRAAQGQDWYKLTGDLDQIAKDLPVSDGKPLAFPLSDVFGSDPFASTTTHDLFTSPTQSLSKLDPFSPIRDSVSPPQMSSPSLSNDFPSSDLFTSQVIPGRGFDPFRMGDPPVTNDPFSGFNEQCSPLTTTTSPPPSKPSVPTNTFDDAFGESFAPSQNQTVRQLQSLPMLSHAASVPFAGQTGRTDLKHPTQQKGPFAKEPLSSKSDVDSFGSIGFGNSQKQEASVDDRFAALRLLDDNTGSVFPTSSDTNKAESQLNDPYAAFEAPTSSNVSAVHQFSLTSNATVGNTAFSTVSNPATALSNAMVPPTAVTQIATDPFAPAGFLSSFNQLDPFQDGKNSSSMDKFNDQRTKESFPLFNQSRSIPGEELVGSKSLFKPTVTFDTQKDPFKSQPISQSTVSGDPFALSGAATQANHHTSGGTTVSSDPFAVLSGVSAQANSHTSGGTAIRTLTTQPSTASSQTSVDPFAQLSGGDLFSTVPSHSTQATAMQGSGLFQNSDDPFSSLGGAPQNRSAVSNDPFLSDGSFMEQMNNSLHLSRSAGSLAIKGVPSSTNPFLTGDTMPVKTSHPNPFADHLSGQSSLLQGQQGQMADNPFVGYTNLSLFDST